MIKSLIVVGFFASFTGLYCFASTLKIETTLPVNRAIIASYSGHVEIYQGEKSRKASLLLEVASPDRIVLGERSHVDLFLPDGRIIAATGPASLLVREGGTAFSASQSKLLSGVQVRGFPESTSKKAQSIARAYTTELLPLESPVRTRGKKAESTPYPLLAPRGPVLSQKPKFRYSLNYAPDSLFFYPGNAIESATEACFPSECSFPFPNAWSPLSRGAVYRILGASDAVVFVLSATHAEDVQKDLERIGRDSPGLPGRLAQVTHLISLGLGSDALEMIDGVDSQVGTSETSLEMRRRAYKLLSVEDSAKAVEQTGRNLKIKRTALDILSAVGRSSSDSSFKAAIIAVSGEEILPVEPGAEMKSESGFRLVISFKEPKTISLFLIHKNGTSTFLMETEVRDPGGLRNTVFPNLAKQPWFLDERTGWEGVLVLACGKMEAREQIQDRSSLFDGVWPETEVRNDPQAQETDSNKTACFLIDGLSTSHVFLPYQHR